MSSAHSTVTYTSESDINGLPWGIHLMPMYESDASETAPHSLEYTSPADDDLEPAEAHALPALARKSVRLQTPLPPSIVAHIEACLAAPTPPLPPPSPLSPLSSPLPRIPSPPLPSSPTRKDTILEPGSTLAQGTVDRLVVTIEETNERVSDLGTRYRQDSHEIYVHLQDAQDDKAMLRA
ncbi:hypothetical protein Tco_1260654 [Tanacetum coccineum]